MLLHVAVVGGGGVEGGLCEGGGGWDGNVVEIWCPGLIYRSLVRGSVVLFLVGAECCLFVYHQFRRLLFLSCPRCLLQSSCAPRGFVFAPGTLPQNFRHSDSRRVDP